MAILSAAGARAAVHTRGEDARTICPEHLASDIMADDVYLLYAYNIGNNVYARMNIIYEKKAYAYMQKREIYKNYGVQCTMGGLVEGKQ